MRSAGTWARAGGPVSWAPAPHPPRDPNSHALLGCRGRKEEGRSLHCPGSMGMRPGPCQRPLLHPAAPPPLLTKFKGDCGRDRHPQNLLRREEGVKGRTRQCWASSRGAPGGLRGGGGGGRARPPCTGRGLGGAGWLSRQGQGGTGAPPRCLSPRSSPGSCGRSPGRPSWPPWGPVSPACPRASSRAKETQCDLAVTHETALPLGKPWGSNPPELCPTLPLSRPPWGRPTHSPSFVLWDGSLWLSLPLAAAATTSHTGTGVFQARAKPLPCACFAHGALLSHCTDRKPELKKFAQGRTASELGPDPRHPVCTTLYCLESP